MPWHIAQDVGDCDGYAVVKDDDGSIAGCHTTKSDAQDQLAALYASENKNISKWSNLFLPETD